MTSNVEQAIHDSRAIFLVCPKPDPKLLSGLIDTGRALRWIPEGTDQGTWVDGFARFLLAKRLSERAQAQTRRARRSAHLSDPRARRRAS